jgi:hypothetical protein
MPGDDYRGLVCGTYELAPFGQRLAIRFTRAHGRSLIPGLAVLDATFQPDITRSRPFAAASPQLDFARFAVLDPTLQPDIARCSPVAAARRQPDLAVIQVVDSHAWADLVRGSDVVHTRFGADLAADHFVDTHLAANLALNDFAAGRVVQRCAPPLKKGANASPFRTGSPGRASARTR